MTEIQSALEFVYSITGKKNRIDLYLLCKILGIIVIENHALDKDGYLICANGLKIIFVSSRITNTHRKRFVIAHEIGHFLMHREQLYCCNEIRMNQPPKINTSSQEMQANEFASELLLPTDELIANLPNKHISFALISNLARMYDVSVTMTAIKAVKNSNTEDEILLCYESNQLKWYATGNSSVRYCRIPARCPIELEYCSSISRVSGYWDDLFSGSVSQEIFKPYGKQYLVLLAGEEWNNSEDYF